jgi:Holliday junction DNA helicase RuvA
MIGRLKGTILEKATDHFIIDISGVGYVVYAPASTLKKISPGGELFVYTKCLYKEEEAFIYGFLTRDELTTFVDLISVSGVGPRLGLNLLSAFSPSDIYRAVEEENVDLLSSVAKVGPKIASKIILDLKGKLSFIEKSTTFSQAMNTLCSLGLSRVEAITKLKDLPPNLSLEEMIKQALKDGHGPSHDQ